MNDRETLEAVQDYPELNEGGTIMAAVGSAIRGVLKENERLKKRPEGGSMKITAYELATRFVGVKEIKGQLHNPAILAMLKLDQDWPESDEVPWCSAFVNYVAWLLRLPRSKSLLARSWLGVGVPAERGEIGWGVVILGRGNTPPGPLNLTAHGHVGFYGGMTESGVYVLGGNQGDSVSVSEFPRKRVLGYRTL